MSYQGDTSLAAEIQDRVLTTFDQTTRLAEEGKVQEAQLGCDFILRLDPHFEPARTLHDRLSGAEGPVDTASLQGDAVPDPEVLKTVRLSPEEIERMMAEEANGDGDSLPSEAAEPGVPPANRAASEQEAPEAPIRAAEEPGIEIAAEAASEPEAPADREPEAPIESADPSGAEIAEASIEIAEEADKKAPVGRVQIGGSLEAPGVAARTAQEASEAAESPQAGGDKIEQLLEEGQAAFNEEHYQEAIDSWSRIFLIDIDHAEASKRIDLARQLKEERERELEETFHEGIRAADEGRRAEALERFERVVRIQPNHLAAQEYIDRLNAEAAREAESLASEAGAAQVDSAAPEAAAEPAKTPTQAPVSPDAPAAPRQADESYRMVARAKRPPVSRFFLIGTGVALAVVVVAFLLFSNWGRLFPNSADSDATPQAGERITRITNLYRNGELEAAIAALEEIEPGDTDFVRGQRLLANWREELEATRADDTSLSGEEELRHSDLLAKARDAYADHRYLLAARNFSRASSIAPLSAAEAALFDDAKQQLEPIAQQIDLFNQRQWDLVLQPLWRRLEQDPDNGDVQDLLVNSYYNLAVRDLKRGNARAAGGRVGEALRLAADDEELERLRLFTKTYSEYPRDLLYDIFVQELEVRQ
jgi:tetratricopeptide (TPR) repeat protein